MRLTFYILEKTNLSPGGTWVRFEPDYSNLSFSFENRDKIAIKRLVISGNIIVFKEADFEVFERIYNNIGVYAEYSQTNIVDIKIENAAQSYLTTLNLEQSYNKSLRLFQGEMILKDKYTEIIDRKQSPVSLQTLPDIGTVTVSNIRNLRNIENTLITEPRNTILTLPNMPNYTLPTQSNGLPFGFNLSDAEQDAAGITVVNFRIVSTLYLPETENFAVGGEIDYFRKAISPRSYTGEDTFLSDFYNKTVNFKNYTINESNISITYTKFKEFYNAIRFVVNRISNSTILIDTTGGLTDSFYFLKNYQLSDLSKVYENVAIANLTNIIVNSALEEPDVPATRDAITFDMILKVFDRFSLYWYLEKRGNDTYFMTKHYSEIVQTNGSLNLNNYKGRNWVRFSNKFEIAEPPFTTAFAEQTSDYGEWQNVYLDLELFTNTLPGVRDNSKQLQFAEQNIYTDIDDVITYNSSKYSDVSINNFVLVGLNAINTVFNESIFGGIQSKNNAFFSHVYLFRNFLSELSSKIYRILNFDGSWEFPLGAFQLWGDEFIFPINDNRLDKRKTYEITLPLNYLSEISLNNNVKYLGDWLEIEKGEINVKSSTILLTLRKL